LSEEHRLKVDLKTHNWQVQIGNRLLIRVRMLTNEGAKINSFGTLKQKILTEYRKIFCLFWLIGFSPGENIFLRPCTILMTSLHWV
jgi:hypothetical protein